MRMITAAGLAAASLAIATSGCSSMKMPKLPTFGKKSKPTTAASDGTQLTNAPPAPHNGTMASTTPPAVTSQSSWSNLPMYPGTTYPTTPHPAPAIAQVQHTASPYGAPQAAPAYGAMPTQAAPATAAYAPYPTSPASPANPYAPPAAPPAAQPQGGSYAAAVPPVQGPAVQTPAAPAYAQQAPPYAAPANPYTTPANPYAPPAANPYAAPTAPQNAANPYADSVTR